MFDDRLFEHKDHREWMLEALAGPLDSATLRIPFMHHPPYCMGPRHSDNRDVQKQIVTACEHARIKTLLAGHEHNFQCIDSPSEALRTFVTGGGGGFRPDEPDKSTDGWVRHWGGNTIGHFLIVTVNPDLTANVAPVGANGNPLPLFDASGDPTPGVRSISFTP